LLCKPHTLLGHQTKRNEEKRRETKRGNKNEEGFIVFCKLAVLYFNLKKWPKAEEMYLAALDNYEHVFGSKHPDIAKSCINIGDFYKTQGDNPRAKQYYQRALDIYRTQQQQHHLANSVVAKMSELE